MANKRRWTQEEDTVLFQAISSGSYNLSKCFLSVAAQVYRTPKAVEHRWYNHARFTSAGRKVMLTIGKNSTYTGKNLLSNSKVKPLNRKVNISLWERLLRLLGFK